MIGNFGLYQNASEGACSQHRWGKRLPQQSRSDRFGKVKKFDNNSNPEDAEAFAKHFGGERLATTAAAGDPESKRGDPKAAP
jgi:hypothetical protein